MKWQTVCRLPESEPNASNQADYQSAQLMAGASNDGEFVYDAVYAAPKQCFVLTLMHINSEWGFIEQETVLYPPTRQALLAAIDEFEQNPLAFLSNQ